MCDQYASIQALVLRAPDDLAEKPCARRKKLWELENYYYCSVIGTCLTLPELRQLARKAEVFASTPLSDYELHGTFVNFAREPGSLSRLVQKHLDRKYQRALQQLTRKPSFQDMAAYWQAATATGQVAGAFWALLTHPYTPQELLVYGYGRIPIVSWLREQADESLQHAQQAGELITHLGGHPSLGIGPLLETHQHEIGDILRESLDHEKAALTHYHQLLTLTQNHSVLLEEYARQMIAAEEAHLGEVDKMLRAPGDVKPFAGD